MTVRLATPTSAELEARRARLERSERLSREREVRTVHATARPIELRQVGDNEVEFVGYASTFDDPYVLEDWLGEYTEEVASGAFTKTLAERADVRFLLNHDGLPIARTKSGTLKLSENEIGLRCEAGLDTRDPDVQLVIPKLERQDLAEMSFAFRRIRYEWNEEYDHCKLLELKLYDVSLVTYPANPNTWGGLRSGIELLEALANTDVEELLTEARSDHGGPVMAAAARAQELIDQVLREGRVIQRESQDLPERDSRDTGLTLEMAQRHLDLIKASSR